MLRRKLISERARDLLVYVAIAILVVTLVGVFAIHQAKTGGTPDLPLKWLGFGGMSAIVFGYAIRNNRSSWGQPRFWGLLAIFALFHFAAALAILLRTLVIPMLYYGVATGIEYFVLSVYLSHFLGQAE